MATSHSTKNLKSFLIPVGIILAVIVIGLTFLKFQAGMDSRPAQTVELKAGETLPDFTLTKMGNASLPVSKMNAKVILINFWATWCEACVSEMPSIVKLREKFHDKGLEVVAVNLDENPEAVVPKAAADLGIQFDVFKDPEGQLADLFDVHAIPLTVIISHDRKILYIRDGELNWNSEEMNSRMKAWLNQ